MDGTSSRFPIGSLTSCTVTGLFPERIPFAELDDARVPVFPVPEVSASEMAIHARRFAEGDQVRSDELEVPVYVKRDNVMDLEIAAAAATLADRLNH